MRKMFFHKMVLVFVMLVTMALLGFISCAKNDRVVKHRVVIATLLSHPALDQIPENLKKELTRKGEIKWQ